jgi:hypothetical protein
VNVHDGLPARITALPEHTGRPPIVSHRLAAPGCDVLFIFAPAGATVPMHDHDTDNVTVVVRGETIVSGTGGTLRCGPGQWYETAAAEAHAVHFDVDTVQIELRFATASGGDDD